MLLAWPFLIGFGLANNSLHGILPVMALVLLFGSRGLTSLFVAAGSGEQVITAVGDYFKVAVVSCVIFS